jgi:hypothetical protein
MLTPPAKSLSIASNAHKTQLSKSQKTFNTLIKQIEQGRAQLAAWEVAIPRYQQKHAGELQPLLDQAQALDAQSVHALDKAHGLKEFSKNERRKIAMLITDLAESLLAEHDDPAIKAVYNKYSEFDYDEALAEDHAMMKDALEEALGIDLGDDFDPNSPEDIADMAAAKMREKQTAQNAEYAAWQNAHATRKKSPRQLAREAREQADEQQLKQSIREIYRKLASALHPDREPDPAERERKTALMQKVNQAYDKNNLLLLLELQLELEQIDQAHIDNVGEDRLKHYNKILREQLDDLRHEIERVETGFVMQYAIDPFAQLNPNTLIKQLDADIADARMDLRDLKRDHLAFADAKKLKAWLKTVRLPSKNDPFGDFPF